MDSYVPYLARYTNNRSLSPEFLPTHDRLLDLRSSSYDEDAETTSFAWIPSLILA